jgi:hypothetical protein
MSDGGPPTLHPHLLMKQPDGVLREEILAK